MWSLLGNEYVSELLQYRELLRLAASHFGVLEAMEAATGVDAAERARPVMPMAEIKRMYRLPDEEAEEECLAAFGSMFEAWGDEDDDDVDEAEAEGAADDTLASAGCANGGGGGCSSRLPAYALEVQVPWSRRLLDGTKTIETRAYLLPAEVLQQPVLLVESPAGGGLAAHGLGAVSLAALGIVMRCAQSVYPLLTDIIHDPPQPGPGRGPRRLRGQPALRHAGRVDRGRAPARRGPVSIGRGLWVDRAGGEVGLGGGARGGVAGSGALPLAGGAAAAPERVSIGIIVGRGSERVHYVRVKQKCRTK